MVRTVMMGAIVQGLTGGALIGLGAAMLLFVHGQIAGISGILGRAVNADGGRTVRLGFLAGLIVTGAILAALQPSTSGARGIPSSRS